MRTHILNVHGTVQRWTSTWILGMLPLRSAGGAFEVCFPYAPY